MVVCIIALPILLILGLFSATHRELARESIECALRKATFRPCNLSVEQKIKRGVFGALMKRNKKIAFFTFKHFEALSIVFGVLMVLSLAGTAWGVYNLALYGNCNGPATSEFCVFSPETYSSGIELFGMRFFETVHSPEEIKPITVGNAPSVGNPNAPVRITEVGCFSCPYTKAAEPLVKELLEKHGEEIYFTFMYFPLPNHAYSFEASNASECAREQGKFWEFKEKIFEIQSSCVQSPSVAELNSHFDSIALELGLDTQQFRQCTQSLKYSSLVEEHKQHAIDAGIYGTPTFYVNGHVLVAPESLEQFEELMQ
jgi:protein-disulfide isomerase